MLNLSNKETNIKMWHFRMEFGVPLSPSVALPRWMKTDTDHRSCPLSYSGLLETLYLAANLAGCGHFSDEFLRGSGFLLRLAVRRLVRAPGSGRLRYPCLRHPAIRPPGRTRGASAPQRQRADITQEEIREALPDLCWSKCGTIAPQWPLTPVTQSARDSALNI